MRSSGGQAAERSCVGCFCSRFLLSALVGNHKVVCTRIEPCFVLVSVSVLGFGGKHAMPHADSLPCRLTRDY